MDNFITSKSIIRIFFKQKMIIFASIFVFMSAAFIYQNTILKIYEAEIKILIKSERKNISSTYKDLNALRRYQPVVNQSEIVKSRLIIEPVVNSLRLYKRDDKKKYYSVLRKTIQPVIIPMIEYIKNKLGIFVEKSLEMIGKKKVNHNSKKLNIRIKTINKLRKKLIIRQIQDSDIFYIGITDYSPSMAQKIVNTIGRQYVIYDMEQQLANLQVKYGDHYPEVAQLKEQINSAKDYLTSDSINDLTSLGLGTVIILEPAFLPVKPIWPKAIVLYIAMFVGAIVFGIAIIVFLQSIDSTFQNPWEFEASTAIPVLGSIPIKKFSNNFKLRYDINLDDICSSAYNNIVDNIYMILNNSKEKVIIVSDLSDIKNSSINAFFISKGLSSLYRMKVVLIDADLRENRLSKYLKKYIINKKGITDYIRDTNTYSEIMININEKIDFVYAGKTTLNPLLALNSTEFKDLIKKLKNNYDIIVVCSSSLLKFKDTSALIKNYNALILSLSESSEKKEAIKRIFKLEPKIKDYIWGAIFNDRSSPIPRFIYKRI